MDRLRVVTSFVAHKGRVLLAKRSDKVSTYRGRWAGISGTVAPGELPEVAAWRELEEETGLGQDALRLVRAGLPLDVEDVHGKRPRRFRVHPFLFALEDGAEVELNQEHTEGRFADPDELIVLCAVGDTVPELDEALARVWDPPAALPPHYREEARALVADRQSGAAELALRAAALVMRGAPAERVAALRPSMASVVNAARAAAQPGRDVGAELGRARERAEAAARAELRAGMRVATWSRSSTVVGALRGAPRVALVVGKSDPGGEGAAIAREAGQLGHEATLLDDEELRRIVAQGGLDLVLVGADAVTAIGDVVNKLGTRALAEAAAQAGTPFVVAADEWKHWPDTLPPPLEASFDLTPHPLITRLAPRMGSRVSPV